jgi:hypothetical protein
MAIHRKPEAAGRNSATPVDDSRPMVAVPRTWLFILAALLIAPWLAALAVYLRAPAESVPVAPPVSTAGPATALPSGPWGTLTASPIVVSPPLEYVAADWGRASEPDTWYFPGTTPELLEAFLVSTGLPQDQAARIRSTARLHPGIRGLVVTPDPEIVRKLPPDVRSRLYVQLAKSTLNFDQASSFRFLGSSPEDWLGGTMISRETRQLTEQLIYRDGDFLNFADVEIVRASIRDEAELRRLAKALLRQSTLLVRLSVDDPSSVDSLADYWGRGGRRIDLRPLLESIVGAADHSIDLVHLLPTLARQHLYRYPKISTGDLNKPLLANCLWTSLNFFSTTPDDRFLDVTVALDTLRRDYYVVEDGFQLGDIIGFVDDEGDLFHAAVYIAADLVYTKNGTSPMAPWTIVSLDYLKGYYKRHADDLRLIYHRRNDL